MPPKASFRKRHLQESAQSLVRLKQSQFRHWKQLKLVQRQCLCRQIFQAWRRGVRDEFAALPGGPQPLRRTLAQTDRALNILGPQVKQAGKSDDAQFITMLAERVGSSYTTEGLTGLWRKWNSALPKHALKGNSSDVWHGRCLAEAFRSSWCGNRGWMEGLASCLPNSLIVSRLLFGAAVWSDVPSSDTKKIESFVMKMYRSILDEGFWNDGALVLDHALRCATNHQPSDWRGPRCVWATYNMLPVMDLKSTARPSLPSCVSVVDGFLNWRLTWPGFRIRSHSLYCSWVKGRLGACHDSHCIDVQLGTGLSSCSWKRRMLPGRPVAFMTWFSRSWKMRAFPFQMRCRFFRWISLGHAIYVPQSLIADKNWRPTRPRNTIIVSLRNGTLCRAMFVEAVFVPFGRLGDCNSIWPNEAMVVLNDSLVHACQTLRSMWSCPSTCKASAASGLSIPPWSETPYASSARDRLHSSADGSSSLPRQRHWSLGCSLMQVFEIRWRSMWRNVIRTSWRTRWMMMPSNRLSSVSSLWVWSRCCACFVFAFMDGALSYPTCGWSARPVDSVLAAVESRLRYWFVFASTNPWCIAWTSWSMTLTSLPRSFVNKVLVGREIVYISLRMVWELKQKEKWVTEMRNGPWTRNRVDVSILRSNCWYICTQAGDG